MNIEKTIEYKNLCNLIKYLSDNLLKPSYLKYSKEWNIIDIEYGDVMDKQSLSFWIHDFDGISTISGFFMFNKQNKLEFEDFDIQIENENLQSFRKLLKMMKKRKIKEKNYIENSKDVISIEDFKKKMKI